VTQRARDVSAQLEGLLRVRRARRAAAERDVARARLRIAAARRHVIEARSQERDARLRLVDEALGNTQRIFEQRIGVSVNALVAGRERVAAAESLVQAARGARLARVNAWRQARSRLAGARVALFRAVRRELRLVELSTGRRNALVSVCV
jgi:hypothetical protein